MERKQCPAEIKEIARPIPRLRLMGAAEGEKSRSAVEVWCEGKQCPLNGRVVFGTGIDGKAALSDAKEKVTKKQEEKCNPK